MGINTAPFSSFTIRLTSFTSLTVLKCAIWVGHVIGHVTIHVGHVTRLTLCPCGKDGFHRTAVLKFCIRFGKRKRQ